MKKLITITVLLAAMASQAVSFSWDSNKVKIQFDGATTLAAAGSITASLIYLGTDSSATIEGYSIKNGFEADSISTKSTGLASGKGTYSGTFTKVLGTKFGNEATFNPGDYFTVLLTYTDSNSVTWYNLASSTFQVPSDAEDLTTGLAASFTHSFDMKSKGTALSAGGGWTAVPEPSTAALALAGLALLLKRRKA